MRKIIWSYYKSCSSRSFMGLYFGLGTGEHRVIALSTLQKAQKELYWVVVWVNNNHTDFGADDIFTSRQFAVDRVIDILKEEYYHEDSNCEGRPLKHP